MNEWPVITSLMNENVGVADVARVNDPFITLQGIYAWDTRSRPSPLCSAHLRLIAVKKSSH
ncbi:hypothetical protein [Pseudomonas sp. HLT2-19-2]